MAMLALARQQMQMAMAMAPCVQCQRMLPTTVLSPLQGRRPPVLPVRALGNGYEREVLTGAQGHRSCRHRPASPPDLNALCPTSFTGVLTSRGLGVAELYEECLRKGQAGEFSLEPIVPGRPIDLNGATCSQCYERVFESLCYQYALRRRKRYPVRVRASDDLAPASSAGIARPFRMPSCHRRWHAATTAGTARDAARRHTTASTPSASTISARPRVAAPVAAATRVAGAAARAAAAVARAAARAAAEPTEVEMAAAQLQLPEEELALSWTEGTSQRSVTRQRRVRAASATVGSIDGRSARR